MIEKFSTSLSFKQRVYHHHRKQLIRKRLKKRGAKALRQAYKKITVENWDDFVGDYERILPEHIIKE